MAYRAERKGMTVRFDGTETSINAIGKLTLPDVEWLIEQLREARDRRQDFRARCKTPYTCCESCNGHGFVKKQGTK